MKLRISFEEFVASRKECADLGAALRDEILSGRPGLLYLDALYIEKGDLDYCLTIGNFSDVGACLNTFEKRLYRFAKSEGYCDIADDTSRSWGPR